MKLNEDAPEQHLAIIVLAGIFLTVNLVAAFKDSRKNGTPADGVEPLTTQIVDESGNVIEQPTLHRNPTLSWTELFFCRGLKRSSWCSYRELHPDTLEADENGVEVADALPKKEHVVLYRGPMPRESVFTGRASIPEPEAPQQYQNFKGGTTE